ncbi:MAG: prephenate/arogenate dehydrogenase [Leptolyngbyaceae cyanobacterium]
MKIGIVGLGLIGGSLGLDFRQLGHEVIGVARRSATCETAIARGAVDHADTELQVLQSADIVFLCTPIHTLASITVDLVAHLSPTTVLTDVGSVKGAVVQTIEPHWPNFVGGHPMAGKSEVGIAVAEANLFAHRAYVITPTAATPPTAIACLTQLVTALQAEIFTCSPAAHDRAVAWISHLPVMVSSSLIQACLQEPDPTIRQLARAFASSGFRDTSRVGGGHPELGIMMAQYNRAELLRSLHTYQQALQELTELVATEQWEALASILATNYDIRPSFTQPAPAPDTAAL